MNFYHLHGLQIEFFGRGVTCMLWWAFCYKLRDSPLWIEQEIWGEAWVNTVNPKSHLSLHIASPTTRTTWEWDHHNVTTSSRQHNWSFIRMTYFFAMFELLTVSYPSWILRFLEVEQQGKARQFQWLEWLFNILGRSCQSRCLKGLVWPCSFRYDLYLADLWSI